MDIIDAMIALQMSPLDLPLSASEEALERANLAYPGNHQAKRILDAFLKEKNKLSDCIQTVGDLNRLLQGFSDTEYPKIFQSIESRIDKIITSKGGVNVLTKSDGLLAVFDRLKSKKLTTAVTSIRKILPKFNEFVEELINPNPPPLTFWSVRDLKHIGERALQRKFPEGERVTATLFPQKIARRLNDSSSWIKGLVPIHTALGLGLIANQVQEALTSTSFHSKEKCDALTSALAEKNMDDISSSFDALIEETESSFSKINYERLIKSSVAAAFFWVSTNALLTTDYALIAARLSTAAFVLNELYTNRYFLLSLTQKQSLDLKHKDLIRTLSHMEAEFLTPLNQALELKLSPKQLKDPELVKGKLEEYNRKKANPPIVIDDNLLPSCDWPSDDSDNEEPEAAAADDNSDDSPRGRSNSESPPGF